MLGTKILNSAIQQALTLDHDRPIMLKEGTIIYQMVDTSIPKEFKEGQFDTVEKTAEAVSLNTRSAAGTYEKSNHDIAVESACDELANQFAEEVKFCLDKVMPKLSAFKKALNETELPSYNVEDIFDNINLVLHELPTIFSTDLGKELFNTNESNTSSEPIMYDLSTYDDDAIAFMLKTGVTWFDEALANDIRELANSPQELATMVKSSQGLTYHNFSKAGPYGEGAVIVALVNTLFYKNMLIKAQVSKEHSSNINKLLLLRNTWGYILAREVDKFYAAEEHGKVFLYSPNHAGLSDVDFKEVVRHRKPIVLDIYKSSWKKIYKVVGKRDFIGGVVISGDVNSDITVETAISGSENYLNIWNRNVLALKTAFSLEAKEIIKISIRRALDKAHIYTKETSLESYYENGAMDAKAVDKYLADLKPGVSIEMMAIDLIAGILYSKTRAHRFFTTLYERNNDFLNPEYSYKNNIQEATSTIVLDYLLETITY